MGMSRTTVTNDDQACAEVMRRYRLATKRQAINFALRTLAVEAASVDQARGLQGSVTLEAGQMVDVVVLRESCVKGRSIIEVLASGPERCPYQTAERVREYFAEEKASWAH